MAGGAGGGSFWIALHRSSLFSCVLWWPWYLAKRGRGPQSQAGCTMSELPRVAARSFWGHQGAFAHLPPHLFCTKSWLTLFDPSRAYNFRSQTARKLPFICSNLSPSSICSKLRGGNDRRIMFTAGKGKKTWLSVWESLVSRRMHWIRYRFPEPK